ncbi:hypothetical protein J1N35_001979, partial [Gossypium stocksii]
RDRIKKKVSAASARAYTIANRAKSSSFPVTYEFSKNPKSQKHVLLTFNIPYIFNLLWMNMKP